MSGVRTFDVLNIDAWRNTEGGWDWNNCHKCGTVELDPSWSTRKLLNAFRAQGFLSNASLGTVRIDNDGADPTTIEVQDRHSYEPLIAIRVEWD